MKTIVYIAILCLVYPAFAETSATESFELIPPIAKERDDGLDKLPPQTFTDNSGVETWFVEERGFKAANAENTTKADNTKRSPAAKKKSKSFKSGHKNKRHPASKKVKGKNLKRAKVRK
ncbi:MAG: hypothetical protein KDD37_08065 [Bdellovibrionales bacterium]|nr:hypothetical protein [Bdellovibrionales bacterium]